MKELIFEAWGLLIMKCYMEFYLGIFNSIVRSFIYRILSFMILYKKLVEIL